MQSGDRLWYTETRMPVNEPIAPRPRFSVAITGRAVCGKAARTGLWGRRRETSGATRQRAVYLTVVHRLFASGSDRAAERWREAYRLPGTDTLELHHLYRAMAFLGEPLKD